MIRALVTAQAAQTSFTDYYPTHTCTSRSCVIGAGVHIYIYLCIYVYDPKKVFNGTLAVDLPFQTPVVDFSLNL